jgi:hypothetical protein
MPKKKDKLVSIVIAGCNAGKYLFPCLDSIYGQTYGNFEVIFVDNGSCDETAKILMGFPSVTVIRNDINKGFCFANNQGIRKGKGEYFLALNSDVVLDKNFLSEIVAVAVLSGAGLLGSKMLSGNGKFIDSTGLILSRFYRFFDRGSGQPDKGQYDDKSDIFGPCAAAALYKKEMLDDIKYREEYFDEDFFFLGEDFDIAWRARNKNWRARFAPKAVCYHMRNSSGFNGKFRQYLSFRNRYFLLIKNRGIGPWYIFIFFLYDVPRLACMLCANKYTFKALAEMVKLTPKMLKKRR